MGTILIPAMIERGYPLSFALGVVGASGTIGIVIPPSLSLILYGIVSEQSVPIVSRRHSAWPSAGRCFLRLGSRRRAAREISRRAGAAARRANTHHAFGAAPR
jgi:Tripartite ATP-independent periplasmic transporter, DctM component